MRVSYNWLGEYVDLSGVSPEDLADQLTLVGLEVEEAYPRYHYLEKVVAARVVEVKDHPQSDHLTLCRVDAGEGPRQVVCGAPNVRPGLISAWALPGATLPGPLPVGETEIRGQNSSGMLISEVEGLVGPDASGVLELPGDTPLGRRLDRVLGLSDYIYELGITPNRPDCLCVLGIAREAAGIVGRPLAYPEIHLAEADEIVENATSIQILDPDHCPRYAARVIKDVSIGPSPFWLVDRLAAGGVRSINNVVDITNFILLEMGQPLHAFDMNFLDEQRIVVKLAEEGDRFTTLDGVERVLAKDMLMIWDGKKPVAVAGVMGGLNSEIVDHTQDVLLESAYFSPLSVRRTAKRLGLSTEASYRFERGIDPEGCVRAADRAAALMAELAGGRVLRGVVDAHPKPQPPRSVVFNPVKCNRFLGTDTPPEEMVKKLAGIELAVEGDGDRRTVHIPSFRVDLEREVDVFEEAARLVGFNQVPATMPWARDDREPEDPSRALRRGLRQALTGLGLSEVITYAFLPDGFPDRLGLADGDPGRRTVRIVNPLSEEQALMRTTLAPGLLETLRRNRSFGVTDVKIFEIGMTFFDRPDQELPEERLMLAGIMSGARQARAWHTPPADVDFFDAKGVVEDVLDLLNLPGAGFDLAEPPAYLEPRAAARIMVDGRAAGFVGRVKADAAKAFDLRLTGKEAAFLFELDLPVLLAADQGVPQYRPLPRFPLVERDLSIIVPRSLLAGQLLDFVKELDEEWLEDVFLFDVYEGDRLAENEKSLALRLHYRSSERTLTDDEVNQVHQRVMDRIFQAFEARLQAG